MQRKKFKRLLYGRLDPLAIWGSGYLCPGKLQDSLFLNVLALRGELSASRFAPPKDGPICLGDPGLLMSRFINRPKASSGIVVAPHLANRGNSQLCEFLATCKFPYQLLDLTSDPIRVVRAIASAELVISSAMHPIIVAHSYSVPAVWADFGPGLEGSDYKFLDYYSSLALRPEKWVPHSPTRPYDSPPFSLAYDNQPDPIKILSIQKILAQRLTDYF